ncbi:MAG: DEAD/DEAH box helicase [Oscillatoriales cyanobacterium]|nr:MAG: DEAD/DEAH box helicase [Oscillatoriales cyanobacterium]
MNRDIDKRNLSESDIRAKYITPAIVGSGWDELTQIRREFYLTDGRVLVRGRLHSRGNRKFADYVLYLTPNVPIAIVEAKANHEPMGIGMQQALDYAQMLDVPFAYSSNGDGFIERDRTGTGEIERELGLDAFPTPDELRQRYYQWKELSDRQAEIVTQNYYDDGSGKRPRYYQHVAVNRVVEAIAKGQDRILLVMATGTGKTYTAFQIIWRLWKSKTKRRILFLADRNILVDQTKNNDFKPFGNVMTKISQRKIDPSYEIYLSLYQAVSGKDDTKNIYKQFSPDFFDLVVIDECHRGSAAEDSSWREILTYFSSATHIGLTATPKETEEVSNIDYFGEPLYTYSLKQGIDDGFLAPYKVVRFDTDRDLDGWQPDPGQVDKYNQAIEARIYNRSDINRSLILEGRDVLVADLVTQYLKESGDRFQKTIIFCEDTDHAERMRRALTVANADLCQENERYVVRITGDDKVGKGELDNFIMPDSKYPVIATTSELMTTGVDAKTCKLIVLDRTIKSMTKFKQIVGRGTRIDEDFNKTWFTIFDFKQVTKLFADPEFDGDPVQIYEPKPPVDGRHPKPVIPPNDDDPPSDDDDPDRPKRERYTLTAEAVSVKLDRQQVQYYGKDGKLITTSYRDYTRQQVRADYESLDGFLRKWNDAEKKEAIATELLELGIPLDELKREVGSDYDLFDLICHIAFDRPPLTRRERADQVRKRDYFTKYGDLARQVLEALLEKYADEGIETIESNNVLKIPPFSEMGSMMELARSFGSPAEYRAAIQELKDSLYDAS